MVESYDPQSKTTEITIHQARAIEVPSVFSAAVSIIIPFHGQYELCTKLIESIFRFTKSNYYELCLVDDASPNAEYIEQLEATFKKYPSSIVQTKCIRCKTQVGFGAAAEIGFNSTENPYVLVINSDCEVEDVNWLRSLGESLLNLKKSNVRMVAPRTNNPVNGSLLQKADKFQKGSDIVLPKEEHLSMYCFMTHRELFKRVGGFIKSYPYGYYEDEEFAYRLRKYGYEQGVSGKSWIYHEGEATFRALLQKSSQIQSVLDENYERCVKDMAITSR